MNSVDPLKYGKSELIRVEPFVLHFTGSGAILKKLTMAPHPVTQAVIDLSAGACGNRLVLIISCVYINNSNLWGAYIHIGPELFIFKNPNF